MANQSTRTSPFLTPFSRSSLNTLAILHLSRDQQIPVQLKETTGDESRSESLAPADVDLARQSVVNTRFGSFPHNTLANLPWGSQVLASKVDTGSWSKRHKKKAKQKVSQNAATSALESDKNKRDRDESQDDNVSVIEPEKKKRKSDESQNNGTSLAQPGQDSGDVLPKQNEAFRQSNPVATADSGFAHLVPPTPEVWTRALRHRTQVVFTPDYSYILQRLRVRPGTCVIEAGAGSGSFTHAAARAVFNDYPPALVHQEAARGQAAESAENGAFKETGQARGGKKKRYGKVYSFEFHQPRVKALDQEIEDHGLRSIVQLTHRDVYQDGFGINDASIEGAPSADAIFLDLPAPWLALKHLTRSASKKETEGSSSPTSSDRPDRQLESDGRKSAKCSSPLNPLTTTRICTFSPCIEQAQKTISTLRSLGWVDIEMVEIMHKRLEVRRERIGLQEEGLRGANPSPANVEEALARLREIELRQKAFHENQVASLTETSKDPSKKGDKSKGKGQNQGQSGSLGPVSKAERLKSIREAEGKRKLYKEGRLTHRTEPELKTHTSYLVFALLPREWTAEDEELCRKKWPLGDTKP